MSNPTPTAPDELPWQIKVDGLGYASIYGTNEDGGEGDLVAHCFADHEHLIRSAPELLEALDGLCAAPPVATAYDHSLPGCDCAFCKARAAIALAKGDHP